ncbi:hypothetical protein D915_009035 [Fasciola hepatica]|uniref:CX domain-containing protein n=1 Tax=Fasciola hepatica TaxID=6192 RepID=A0A2H1BWP2_FASHE|nr:hypothetical protein D915_009035 [Fasciola hepatica]
MRCGFVLLILVIALLTGFIECGGRGGSKSSSRSGNRYRVVSKGSRSFWKHRSFKPKISSSRSRILFPTLGALAGIYIAHRMRPRVHLSSYDDFDRVTVCPGFRTVIDPATGFEKNYSYFVCPDDPDELWNTYCCLEDTSSQGFCCQSNRYRAISYGSSFATFAAVIIAAVAVYCCCCRGRFRSKRSSNNEDCVLVDEHLTLNPNLPYPTEPPMLSYPTPLGVPSSGGAPINPQPIPTIPPSAPSPALGSAWTSGPSAPPDRRPPMDIPPPPYPGTDPAPPYAVEQSTP